VHRGGAGVPLTDCAHLLRGDVEVVSRLVEEQQVRLREHHPAEGDARLLAAGEERHLVVHLLLFEHELAKQRAKLLVLVPVVVRVAVWLQRRWWLLWLS